MYTGHSLITGGAGFIGSHLAAELIRQGEEVSVIDDLSTGSIKNIEPLKESHRFHYRIDTIENVPLMAELIDQCDTIYHLAAAVGVRLIIQSPVQTIETNTHGTEVVLRLASKKNKRVVFTSTSEVYGKSNCAPFREDQDLVLGPTSKGRWSYACSKAVDEFLALAYWSEKGLPVVVARLFNTVGPRQTHRYGMVIPTLVKQALAGEPITVYGDGEQTRSFTYVGDVVGALVALARHPDTPGEVYNIGNPQEISINQLAALIKEQTHSLSQITHIPYDEAYEAGFEDMLRRVPDITKIKRALDFEPTLGISDILDLVITECRRAGRSIASATV